MRVLSKTKIPDATSGFRAISREAALRLNVLSNFSYTLETLIQAGKLNLAVKSIPIETNKTPRKSRLFSNVFTFLKNSASTILRTYAMHEPLKIFLSLAALFFLFGLIPGIRFLVYFFSGNTGGHIQSLILSAILLIISFLLVVVAIIAILMSLLLPALRNIREQGRIVYCMSNLRQVSHSLVMYAGDNSRWLPEGGRSTFYTYFGDFYDRLWKPQLYPDYLALPDICYCPSNGARPDSDVAAPPWTYWDYLNEDYCIISYNSLSTTA